MFGIILYSNAVNLDIKDNTSSNSSNNSNSISNIDKELEVLKIKNGKLEAENEDLKSQIVMLKKVPVNISAKIQKLAASAKQTVESDKAIEYMPDHY